MAENKSKKDKSYRNRLSRPGNYEIPYFKKKNERILPDRTYYRLGCQEVS
ncbi:hypothetical protein [Chryseobacterium sp. P1-3]|nr:hypothetical protein [Chryseobacterium sp. P1-3]